MKHPLPYTTTLPKTEKLCSKKLIEELFTKGSSVYLYPFRLHWLPVEAPSATYPSIVFSVPKKTIKRANRRNLIRRRMREIYRLHKHEWLNSWPEDTHPMCLGIVYIAKEILPTDVLEKKCIAVWKRAQNHLV